MRKACLLLFAFALFACGGGGVRWQKAGADEATLASDLSACRKQAQATHGSAAAMAPAGSIDPRFGPTGPTPADSLMQQEQAAGSCMRAKGYTLVNVEK